MVEETITSGIRNFARFHMAVLSVGASAHAWTRHMPPYWSVAISSMQCQQHHALSLLMPLQHVHPMGAVKAIIGVALLRESSLKSGNRVLHVAT